MQSEGKNIRGRQSPSAPGRLRQDDVVMRRISEIRRGRAEGAEEVMSGWFTSTPNHTPPDTAHCAMGGEYHEGCNAEVNCAAFEADWPLHRQSTIRRFMQGLMYDHPPFSAFSSKARASHYRPRRFLLTGTGAAQNINAAVSQVEDKQQALKQEDGRDDAAEPP